MCTKAKFIKSHAACIYIYHQVRLCELTTSKAYVTPYRFPMARSFLCNVIQISLNQMLEGIHFISYFLIQVIISGGLPLVRWTA